MLSYIVPSTTTEDKPNPFRPPDVETPTDDVTQIKDETIPECSVTGADDKCLHMTKPSQGTPILEPPTNVDDNEEVPIAESEGGEVSDLVKCVKVNRIDGESGDRSPGSENRSMISDTLTTPGSEDRSISKFSKPALKRVSFGSSKGSMVETLIYDTATIAQDKIPEENGTTNDVITDPTALKYGTEVGAPQRPASKVRVSFFQSERPLIVTSPEPTSSELDSPCSSSLLLLDSPALLSSYPTSSLLSMMTSPSSSAAHVHLDRQLSSESGRDNPFRPDGDISREADEIVQLIKSGKPLAEATALAADSPMADDSGQVDEPLLQDSLATNQQAGVSPPSSPQHSAPLNGSSAPTPPSSSAAAATITASPATVEVTHTTIPPSQPAVAPEHVVLKKKSKCGACCVIQ